MRCAALMLFVLFFSSHSFAGGSVRILPILGGDESMQVARRALDLRDYDALGKVVAEHPGVGNRLFENGESLLNYAAYYGDVVAVGLLLKEGADPNAGRDVGSTPLYGLLSGLWDFDYGDGYLAAQRTDFAEILVMLIQHGARYNDFYEGRSVLSPDEDISTITSIVKDFCKTKAGKLRHGYEESNLSPLRDSSIVFRVGLIQAFQIAVIEYYSRVGVYDSGCVRIFAERIEITD